MIYPTSTAPGFNAAALELSRARAKDNRSKRRLARARVELFNATDPDDILAASWLVEMWLTDVTVNLTRAAVLYSNIRMGVYQ